MSTTSERTGLIDHDEHAPPPLSTTAAADVSTPLKWGPLSVLLLLSAMQPLAFDIVFPFVNQMIVEIGVVTDPEQVGFYSGVVESIFSCMSFIAILPCSILSDRIGRKPVLLVGMLGLALSVICFGMSKSFLAMVLSRCLGGALGGVWACTRIVMGELTDRTNQGTAFSAHTIAFRTGQIIGLPLGGLLAHPERNFVPFRTAFWYEYPFALPCFVAATLCSCGVILGYFYLPETLESKRKKAVGRTTYGTVGSPSDIDSAPRSPTAVLPAEVNLTGSKVEHTYRSILTPSIISLLCSNIAMGLVADTLFSVLPLFSFTPIASGGLGMSEAAIGIQMSVRAALHIGIMVFFAPLQRRLGAVGVYQLSMFSWPLVTLCFPLLNFMAREGKADGWLFMLTFFVFLFIWSIGGFAWTAIVIMVTDAAPSPGALATINGLSQMSMALPQAIAPASVTSLFAASIKSKIAGGNLIWIIMFIITCGAAAHSLTLRTPSRDWRHQ